MEQRWGDFDNPLVKGVAGSAILLFLALNFPLVFLAVVAAALCYAVVLLAVTGAYRNRYGIVGKPELAARFATNTLASLKEGCERTMARTLEKRGRRKRFLREREERLRRYKRERNRRRREQARNAPA